MSQRHYLAPASFAILFAAACGGKSVESDRAGDLGDVVAGSGGTGTGGAAGGGNGARPAAGGTTATPPRSGCEPPQRGKISGIIDGVRVETPGEVFSGGSGVASSERWSLAWSLA